MIDKLNVAVKDYKSKWKKLIDDAENKEFLENQKPTAVALKVTDLNELLGCFNELRDICDQIHWGWVNERWLLTMHLKDKDLEWEISIIKLMQRRPGTDDPVGLDHIDFWNKENGRAEEFLDKSNLNWTKEQNSTHCKWTSIWFANTEAKLRTDTVLDPCIAELKDTKAKILEG
jgi:hypothetical protein